MDPTDPTCELVLPCRDEAAALPAVLARVPPGLPVLVVDNGSADGTAQVARRLGARVVRETTPGYGAAVHAGLLTSTADVVAVMDGDGSVDPAQVLPMLREVGEAGTPTLAVGRRRPTGRGVWPWHARAGTAATAWWLRRRTGLAVHDVGAVRVGPRRGLLALGVRDRRFGYPVELLVRAREAGWEVHEHDVGYAPRATGTRSKVSGSVRGTVRAAWDFARVLP